MRQHIDIDQLMAETWLTVAMLKNGAVTLDGMVLYNRCVKQVESVGEALVSAGFDEASIEHISYAQCALLDEAVMSRKARSSDQNNARHIDDGQMAWRRAPLQARFFGSLYAGEVFWDRVAEVLRQPAPNEAVLTCFHRVIALGFQGLYSLNEVNQTQRDDVVKVLSERVAPPDANLSLIVRPMSKHRWSLTGSTGFWIVLAAFLTGMAWWGGHLWLQALLSAQIPGLRG